MMRVRPPVLLAVVSLAGLAALASLPACSNEVDALPDAPPTDGPVADAAVNPDGMVDAMVDVTPPETTITEAPPALDNSTSAQLQFEADEDATFECTLDGGAAAPCDSPFTASPLSDGEHTFTVTATDLAGNPDPTPASHTWTVDSSTPDTAIDNGPGGITGAAVNTTNATFAFSSPDAGPGATFECSLDGAAFATCTSPESFTGLAAGAHTFAVRVRDSANNPDPTPAMWSWTIDLTDPDTTIASTPGALTNATFALFTFTSTESPATFECRLDSAAFGPCLTPAMYNGLSDGSHTFRVRSIDAAGNTDTSPATFTWTIDTAAPNTTITATPANPTNATTATFSFTSTDGAATFDCQLDGGSFTACSSPRTYSGLAAGAHTFAVRSTDEAGNTDATPATFNWTVDTTPPDTSITATPSTPTQATSATFSFTSTETGSTFACQLDGGGFTACTSPRTYNSLSEGSHTFAVRATDPAGNTDPTPATFTWTVDTTAPDTTITANPPTTTTSSSATFAFTATESGSTFECRLDAAAFAACGTPQSFSGLADGTHTFRVRATDAAGNTDATPAQYTWTIDSTAPDTNITSNPPSSTTSTSATFAFTSTESGSTFECRLDSAVSFTSCTTPQSYSGLADGSHTFRVRATDGAGNTDATPAQYTWSIDSTPPTVTNVTSSTANGTYGLTDTISIQIAFSDAVSVSGTPTLALETGAVDRTAGYTGGSGTSTLTFQYTVQTGDVTGDLDYRNMTSLSGSIADGAGNPASLALPAPGASGSLGANKAIVIDGVAPVVTITGPADGNTVGPHVRYAFSVDDGSATQCRIDGGTAFVCVTGFDNNLPAGAHTITVFASDAAGNTGTDTNSFTVTCGPNGGGYGAFHMSEGNGTITANSGTGFSGLAFLGINDVTETVDPTWVTGGRFGNALQFFQSQGDTMRWTAGAASALTVTSHAFETWFRPVNPSGGGNKVLFRSGDQRLTVGYTVLASGGVQFFYRLMEVTGIEHVLTNGPFAIGTYHHVVASYDGASYSLWVDGNEKTEALALGSSPITIGSTMWGGDAGPIDGVLDELFFFTSSLNDNTVKDRYCPL
jgi:large repetitive protein